MCWRSRRLDILSELRIQVDCFPNGRGLGERARVTEESQVFHGMVWLEIQPKHQEHAQSTPSIISY